MNKPNNRRSKETKEKCRDALLMLLSEGKTIGTISVRELCEKCNINRSTFYAHYSIPEDILKETEDSTLQETQHFITSMAGNENENTVSFLSFIKQNQKAFRILLSENSQTGFADKLISLVIPIFTEIEQTPFPRQLFPYVRAYAIDGAKAVIFSWINNSCKESEELIAGLIIELSKKVIDTSFTFKPGPDLP